MKNDSIQKTFLVAVLLCAACSIIVSTAAVKLKSRQVENKKLDIKKNLLIAANMLESKKPSKDEILKAFENIETKVIDFETGEYVDMDPESYDQEKASKDPKRNHVIEPALDSGGIKTRAKYGKIYFAKEGGKVSKIIVPIKGKGLWSTLYGFMVVSADVSSIQGIGFYQHGETPGLGGEIENPRWQAIWNGKKIYKDGKASVKVIKGAVTSSMADSEYKIDGLSGATITSVGVEGLVNYWFGEDGYKKFLMKLKNGNITASL